MNTINLVHTEHWREGDHVFHKFHFSDGSEYTDKLLLPCSAGQFANHLAAIVDQLRAICSDDPLSDEDG